MNVPGRFEIIKEQYQSQWAAERPPIAFSIMLICPDQPASKSIQYPVRRKKRAYICCLQEPEQGPVSLIAQTNLIKMGTSFFSTSFSTDKDSVEVFHSINHVRGWWSGEIEGDTDKAGAAFSYRVPGVHYSRQKIDTLIPGKRIVWLVTDAELSFVQDKHEWKGTRIIFEITEKGGKTEVHFTHEGLAPSFECYKDCSNAWGLLINGNLRNLILTGEDQPSPWENAH
jgi:hypothetical protein